MYDISIKVENYKCFEEETGFDEILRVNIIIGRNNTGKSSLLDIIEILTERNYLFDDATRRNTLPPLIIYTAKVTQQTTSSVFNSNMRGGQISGNHGEYGRQFIGREIKWTKTNDNLNPVKLISCDDEGIQPDLLSTGEDYDTRLLKAIPIIIESKKFKRVLAERDISPEPHNGDNIKIQPNGNGITNVIQCFINRSNLPSDLIEIDLLQALNEIFAHDALFTSIVCQLHEDNNWEIYLEEEHKGRVALSKSGSGLKTVITVLANLFLVPKLEGNVLSEYIFGFEELENNIHPALLRRLNSYIYRSSVDNDFIFFLTTHSNVLIDQFSKQKDAQIIHVTQHESIASCNTVKTYFESNGVLDDLDVRASDLLQANGIIWVEGPSDRIYINRWIEIWSEGELKEGTHYQVLFYGGRLLSHLSAEDPNEIENAVSILNTNRNAIIMIDSDKRAPQTRINNTKQRIKSEFNERNSICWITKGKEIENYIPNSIVDQFLATENSSQVGQYDSFFEYLDQLKEGEGKKFSAKKPLLADKLIPSMTLENMSPVLDLDEQMVAICSRIINWNN